MIDKNASNNYNFVLNNPVDCRCLNMCKCNIFELSFIPNDYTLFNTVQIIFNSSYSSTVGFNEDN